MSKLLLGSLFLLATVLAAQAEPTEQWTSDRDPHFGFSYSYPVETFMSVKGDRPSFHYYDSQETGAKFLVGAWNNEQGSTPEEFKQWMLTHAGGYEDITYQPHGRSWFVLSGHRGDQIYYEKAIFSCDGRVATVLAIVYPQGRRHRFDPLVERMEDSFKTGHTCS
jgi:hypothetical protein